MLAVLGLSTLLLAAGEPLRSVAISDCMPGVADYTLLWWAHGWNRGAPAKPQLLCLQTGCYGLVLDVEKMELPHFGEIPHPKSYESAAREDHTYLASLPKGRLELAVAVGDTWFRCSRAATDQKDWMNFPVRMVENGRWLQRFDVLQLQFTAPDGRRLEAEGRLEGVAWPDRLCLLLEVTPRADWTNAALSIALGGDAPNSAERSRRTAPTRWAAGETRTASLVWNFRGDNAVPVGCVAATDPARPQSPPAVTYDEARGWHRVELPHLQGGVAEQPDRLDRYPLVLRNPTGEERVVRLLFDAVDGIPGITGFTPLWRDSNGVPSGLPVQLSKNWHRQKDRRLLYEGPWFHGLTAVRLPPHSEVSGEFALTWARWGGVPAASHAQLCLIGWGWNQLWDQAAIGSWGESICYEPDAVQQRCRIDDVRPLMVWGMDGGQARWSWTHNVGGGDFLVYFDPQGEYVPWYSVKTAYLAHGPNLTEVVYAGLTADRAVKVAIRVSSPRGDDLNRAYHRIRYEVLKPVRFSRLAFYQLGSDNYHWHQYQRLARGNESGLIEEWTPERGGRKYARVGIPCPGAVPWFSLHEAIAQDGGRPVQGAWANRGVAIRSWKARLAGQEAPAFASVYGTQAGNIPSANLELSAPPGVTELRPGDFVEAEIELLVLPMSAADYYGPNENLRVSLREQGNTWRPVWRQAVGNRLSPRVLRGRLLRDYPLSLEVDEEQIAEVEIDGGLGYVPVSFVGLTHPRPGALRIVRDGKTEAVDQSVHGRDFWQTDYDPTTRRWRVTYNVPMDTPGDGRRPATLRFEGR